MKTTQDKPFQDLADDWILERMLDNPKWQAMGRSKSALDCFGFIHEFYRDVLDLYIPEVEVQVSDLATARYFDQYKQTELPTYWEQTDKPEPWNVVTMGRNDKVFHVGLYHPTGIVYHMSYDAGLVGRPLRLLQSTIGYPEFKFYKHKGHHALSSRA